MCLHRKLQGRGSRKKESKSISAASFLGNHCAHSPPFPVKKKSRISLPIPCPPSWKSICLPFIFFYTWFIFFFLGKHVFRVHLIESPAFPVSFFIKKTTPDIAPQWVSWKKRSHGSIGPDFFVEFCAHFLCENESIVTKWNYHGNGATRLFRNWSPRPCNALSRFRPIKIFPSYTPNFKRRYTHRDLALF